MGPGYGAKPTVLVCLAVAKAGSQETKAECAYLNFIQPPSLTRRHHLRATKSRAHGCLDEEATCISEYCTRATDQQGPTLFQHS